MRIRPNSLGFTLLLNALAALPPLAIDKGLPTLAALGTSLNASPAATGLTLSFFMAGFAIAQLVFGPFSDRYGRRPILLMGCGVFALANVMRTIAPSINALIVWRFIAGAGAGAAAVLEMAIVRDLFEGSAARAQCSYINLVMSIAPMIAPIIGRWVLITTDWRSIYGVLAVGGSMLLIAIATGFGESIPHCDKTAIAPRCLIHNYFLVLGDRICVGYALVNGLSFGCMFAYVAGSPLVLIDVLGLSTAVYGWFFVFVVYRHRDCSKLDSDLLLPQRSHWCWCQSVITSHRNAYAAPDSQHFLLRVDCTQREAWSTSAIAGHCWSCYRCVGIHADVARRHTCKCARCLPL